MKKVLINVGPSAPVHGQGYISGIGKSIIWLINAISEIPKERIPFDIELYASGIKSFNFDYYNWKYPRHTICLPQTKGIYNGKNLPCYYRNAFLKYDLFHITDNYDYTKLNEQFITTIHDLDAYLKSNDRNFRRINEEIARRSRRIVCCSNYTKQDIVNYYNIDPKKIDVIYWGCDRNLFKKLSDDKASEVLKKFNIINPYFFSCSCSNPRKNIDTALRAFKKFLSYNPEHIFVIAWSNPRKEILDEFAKEITDGKIVFLPHTSDEDLVALYNKASMSVYVTRREGFGFPILESYACSTPIMTCRNTCLEEIGQDAAIYVGEDDIDEMVDVMLAFENISYDIELFYRRSQAILNNFSWSRCADEYIDFYKKSLGI